MAREQRGRLLGAVSVLAVAALALGVIIWAKEAQGPDQSPGQPSQASSAGFGSNMPLNPVVAPPSGPLGPNAERTTLLDAERDAPFPLYRPHDPLASDGGVSEVWSRAGALPEVAILYEFGPIAYITDSQILDPQSFYEEQIREGASGHVVDIHGHPCLVVPSRGGSVASMDLVVSGVEVQVTHLSDASEQDLVRLAESIDNSAEQNSEG